MTIDLATAQAHLDAWLAADLATAGGQSYSINNRSLTRTDADLIRENISHWQRVVDQLNRTSSGPRATFATFEDPI